MSILKDAADFALAAAFDRLPGELVEAAKTALLDFVGVALAGSRETAARIAQEHVRNLGGRPRCRVLGTSLSAPEESAALANGVAGHALDFDDTSWTTIGHPTVTVAPVVLALGETGRVSGGRALAAYVLGVEIQNKIAALVMPEVSENGWHTTSVFGTLGAAAAAAWLDGLPPDRFVSALGIAASKAGGIKANFGTMTKPYHAGMAAANGLAAARLAGLGLTASPEALEGTDGFFQVFSGRKGVTGKPAFGAPWDLLKPGLALKKYPCCSGAHPALDCLLSLMDRTGLTAGEVESIRVGVSLLGPRELVCHAPASPLQARFSLEHALAAALVHGRAGLAQFSQAAVDDPQIKGLAARIEMEIDPELAQLGFIGTAPAKLQIRLKDGRVIEDRCDLAAGNPEKPLSPAELEEKFLECAGTVLDRPRCSRVLELIRSLEKVADLDQVMELLV